MSLSQKIGILLAIINEKKELKKKDQKLLKGYLNSLRKERNKWAHGVIHFNEEKQDEKRKFQSYLNWIQEDGSEKETKLINSYFDDFIQEKLGFSYVYRSKSFQGKREKNLSAKIKI